MSLLTRLRYQPMVRLGFVLLALVGWGLARPASAEEHEAPQLAAVYFKLEDGLDAGSGPLSDLGANRPARYRSVTVVEGDATRRVAPAAGSIGLRLSGSDAAAVTAQVGPDQVGIDSSGFGNTLADAVAATRVDRFGRFGQLADGGAVAVDLTFARPLAPSDYLLVQEAGGDAVVTLTPIDATGAILGAPVTVDGPFQWDMGRADLDGTPLWARVVSMPATADGGLVPGVRIEAKQAQLKVMALTDVVEEAQGLVASAGAAPSTDQTGKSGASAAPDAGPQEAQVSGMASRSELSVAEGSEQSTVIAVPQEDPSASNAAVDRAPEPVVTPTPGPEPTALAMTGPPTNPWVLTVVAMGLIFFGWSTITACRNPRPSQRENAAGRGSSRGHAQLDALGFD